MYIELDHSHLHGLFVAQHKACVQILLFIMKPNNIRRVLGNLSMLIETIFVLFMASQIVSYLCFCLLV